MQAQISRTDQAALTSQQSLQSIQTLLKAGLGCITYLRNLLPVDNFSESYLTSGPDSISSQPSIGSQSSFSSDNEKRTVSGFKVMTVTRGFTEEADKLLDYLENGIFDALQKQYLRSFIFAIYLDNEDPNNIIEAYTFNFNYFKIFGTDISIPVMSLDTDLQKLSLSGHKNPPDPVSDASANGRVPTLGEVKRSLKALIKNLIQATTQMDPLPKRRYATFKLFYHHHTPDNYEPPYFHPGDAKKDKWFFSTHDKDEIPERCSIGSLKTGHHSVGVRVTSVAGFLPSAEDNNAPFLGTTSGHASVAPTLTPIEEAAMRLEQVQIQRDDASRRRVAWDADDGLCDADADGEDDPTCVPGCDDSNQSISLGSWKVHDSGVEFVAPIGIRDESGGLMPFLEANKEREDSTAGEDDEARYAGKRDSVPNCIAQLENRGRSAQVSQTQRLEQTQVIDSPDLELTPLSPLPRSQSLSPAPLESRNLKSKQVLSPQSTLPPSDVVASEPHSLDQGVESTDTQMVQDLIVNMCAGEDSEMLEIDSQALPQSLEDPIQSFSSLEEAEARAAKLDPAPSENENGKRMDIGTLDCECGVTLEEEACDTLMCGGGCKRRFHTWCMGFHSAMDQRIPSRFVCFDCRVKADQNWDLIIVHDLYPRMIARFKDLAIFRRGIKIFEVLKPDGLSAFTKRMGCDIVVAGQQFKRLETEGFVANVTTETNELGMKSIIHGPQSGTRNAKGTKKGKTRQSQRRRNLQKPKYVFLQISTHTQAYLDYFNPDPEVEKRLLGLSDLKPERKSRKRRAVYDADINMDRAEVLPIDAAGNSTAKYKVQEQKTPKELCGIPSTSQTQDTQLPLYVVSGAQGQVSTAVEYKQRSSKVSEQLSPRNNKKIKISVGPAVDLGD